MDTLNDAIAKEKDVNGLILHSDQGFQYTSYEYKSICESNGIQISISRKRSPNRWFSYRKLACTSKKINFVQQ